MSTKKFSTKSEQQHAWYEANRQRLSDRAKEYYQAHKEEIIKYQQDYREANREVVRQRNRVWGANWRALNPDKVRVMSRQSQLKLKTEVMQAYGGCCFCCGEDAIEFLTVDHIEGGGRQHRLQVKSLYSWLKRNGFPPGFRCACMNCNFALGKHGYCPHTKRNRELLNEAVA